MRRAIIIAAALIFAGAAKGAGERPAEICNHKPVYDSQGKLLAWCEPNVPGAAYARVCRLAAEFIKSCPNDAATNLPYYMVHNWVFNLEHVSRETFLKGQAGSDESHNPACFYAGLVQSLVVDYRVYCGDAAYIDVVRRCLDHQIEHGSTPGAPSTALRAGWLWAKVPYASSDPNATEYVGGTLWGIGGRADGLHVIEPDKVGELGFAYLQFYEVVEERKYLDAAIDCADALCANAFRGVEKDEQWEEQTPWFDKAYVSPWPFRVHAETGEVYEKYCSNVIGAIGLFDELIRISDRIKLDGDKLNKYRQRRKQVCDWLFSNVGPIKSMVWKGYFEDIPNDAGNVNRNQITPLETARYLINQPQLCRETGRIVPYLIDWVQYAFGSDGVPAIKEQFWCYVPMGSHTARFGSICAQWYERTGDGRYKDLAERHLNWATYMTQEDGFVYVTPEKPIRRQIWFSDGYSDYIKHYMAALAAIPEWAPAGEDHLLKSTSVVQKIEYRTSEISYQTYDDTANETLVINSKPKKILCGEGPLEQVDDVETGERGWSWKPLSSGGILKIKHVNSGKIRIVK